MTQRLRFLLDTNVLIPLEDSYQGLERSLANFVRLAAIGGHQLLYHPATIADFERDKDSVRRSRNLQRIRRYPALENLAPCPWNDPITGPNDACDNEILYALACDAVHSLVTEDKRLQAKARAHNLQDRVYTIQTAEDWLRRLHEPRQVVLPNIQNVPMHSLTPMLRSSFFDSLREGYPGLGTKSGFDDWFRQKARENRMAWVYRADANTLAAICVYHPQVDEVINDDRDKLDGKALKLCTLKVGESVRGRKIGELFLKAAFKYATENACENIFIHANAERQDYLITLLRDFGFKEKGTYQSDVVLVKRHPVAAPPIEGTDPLEYVRDYFPHFQRSSEVQKFVVPIQPEFHDTLFPDYRPMQPKLFSQTGDVGNAIKLAYICHAPTTSIKPGDVLLFYRTRDERSITTLSVVERFSVLEDVAQIASMVSRRTVYSIDQIAELAKKPTKVILFRLISHLPSPVSYDVLNRQRIVAGPIQSIRRVTDDAFSRILIAARW